MAKRKRRNGKKKTTNLLLAAGATGVAAVGGFLGYRYFQQREALPDGAKLVEFGVDPAGRKYAIFDTSGSFGWALQVPADWTLKLPSTEVVKETWRRSTKSFDSASDAKTDLEETVALLQRAASAFGGARRM